MSQGVLCTGEPGDGALFPFPRLQPGQRAEGRGRGLALTEWLPQEAQMAGLRCSWEIDAWPFFSVPPEQSLGLGS